MVVRAAVFAACREDAGQREHELRDVFDAVRYVARSGCAWRRFLAICRRGLRCIRSFAAGWPQGSSRRWCRTCSPLRASGPDAKASRARSASIAARCSPPRKAADVLGYDGAKRRKGAKGNIAVDTLGHLLALTVTPADQGERDQVAALAEQVQQVTGSTVELAYVDQGYPGPNAAEAAQQHGIRLEVVKHPMAKRGFVLLPRRWVVERCFAWAARFRRLARDYERLPQTLKGIHFIAFAILMISVLIKLATS